MQEYPETLPVHAREALGINERGNRHFDTVVMGRRTYQPALGAGISSPYPHLRQIVFSTSLTRQVPGVEVVGGDAAGLIRRLKEEYGGGIWLAGGGQLAAEVWAEVDELVIKRNPIVLGTGVPLLDGSFTPRAMKRIRL